MPYVVYLILFAVVIALIVTGVSTIISLCVLIIGLLIFKKYVTSVLFTYAMTITENFGKVRQSLSNIM